MMAVNRSMRFALMFSLALGSAAQACTIPVFRYALDRWEADKFHLVLPTAAASDTALQDLLRPLRANGKANVDITTSREASVSAAQLTFSRDSDRLVWSGALNKDSLSAVLDSPARQKVVSSILAGDSIVWVIAGNESPEDNAEAERIEKRLRFLEQVAALPIQDPNDPDSQLGPGPPLRLKFTTVRVRRDDPAEAIFLKMLAGPKGDIDAATSSFAAVVFGKGRVLGAWPLAVLDDAHLEEASLFMVGRCSCRMKNENPGWDVLLNVDWDQALKQASATTAAPVAAEKAAAPEPVITRVTAAAPPPPAAKSPWPLAAGVVILALGGLLWWVRSGKPGR